MRLFNIFRRWKNGWKVLRQRDGKLVSCFSPCPQEYPAGKTVKRREGNGPFGCFRTWKEAEAFRAPDPHYYYGNLVTIKCKYKASRDADFWCMIDSIRRDFKDTSLPRNTVFADEIKIKKNKNKGS